MRWKTALLPLLLTACATSQLGEFERNLASQASATAALGQWCGKQGYADPPLITATPVLGENPAEPEAVRAALSVSAGEALAYRHVRLSCGKHVLSEAHNWYVPTRLTSEMNAALASTNTPFGKVAAPLNFTRERLSSTRERGENCPSGTILTQRGLLRLPDGTPLALVVECYSAANLSGQ